jgi:hypothetical protein
MRQCVLALGVLAACGNNNGAADAQHDTAPACAPAVPLATCSPMAGMNVTMREIGQVTGGAILATSSPNDGRLFVIQQEGEIRIFEDDVLKPDAFLDINQLVLAEAPPGERGLLGLAFHPNYACNGQFFVDYTTANADVVERFTVSDTDPNKADPNSGEIILSIPDFAENHNGGMIEFGSDGYLYISSGDGGSAGDPHRNAQAVDRTASSCTSSSCEPWLGKILRIDVDHPANGKPYGIPTGNPFSGGGGEPEILIKGLRNPWRWSFDRKTGDMWIGDVGQDQIEELDVIPAAQIQGSPGNPLNLGWSMWEADACYCSSSSVNPHTGGANDCGYTCATSGIKMPQFERMHSDGWLAVIGGQVYHGPCYPDLDGYYFFTDNNAHTLSQAQYMPIGDAISEVDLASPASGWPTGPSSLHADARGELYETTTDGKVYHLEVTP